MVNYATVTDVQIVLGQQTIDTWTNSRINFYLNATTDMINNMLGDLYSSDRTEQIEVCEMDNDYGFVVEDSNVTAIKEIDGVAYTGVYGNDWFIKYGRKIYITNLATYVKAKIYDYFTIKYTAGFTVIPNDIKLLQSLMVAGELSKESGKSVAAYKMGPRSVNYFTDKESATVARNIVSFYNPFYI